MTQPATGPTSITLVATSVSEIIAKVEAQLGKTKAGVLTPLINQYGPVLMQMGAEGITQWIDLAARGDAYAAYQSILKQMDSQTSVDQWDKLTADWKAQNVINAQAVAFQKNAVAGIVNGLVQIGLALVGL